MSKMEIVQGNGICRVHGEYAYKGYKVGESVVGKTCPTCLAEMQRKAEIVNNEKKALSLIAGRRHALRLAGVPDIFLDATLANFESNAQTKRNLDYARGYSTGFKMALQKTPATGLIMLGISGTGKTHLACGIMRKIMEDGYSAAYARVPDLLVRINEATFGRVDATPTQIIDSLSRPHLLVLDEYGAHCLKDEYYQHLFSIIEGRYQRNLPTLLITNLTADELHRELDPRFLERILGNSSGSILSFNWSTYRMKK